MKHKIILAMLFVLLSGIGSMHADTIDVRISPEDRHQTIEGWGVSLCWWANMCGKWDEAKIDTIVKWLTAEDGLNYNIFRYNIGGGDDSTHIGQHMPSGKGARAEMPGFKAGPDEEYDWTADSAQQKIMLKIRDVRPDAIFEAFSNSPPYWMTISGCASGATDSSSDNLSEDNYEAFAEYLLDVCQFYKDSFNLEFRTLEPFNEPSSSYWGYWGGQEGCHFDASSQVKFLRVIYPMLQATGLNTVLSASDETSVTSAHSTLNTFISEGDILPMLGQINTHTYSGSLLDKANLQSCVSSTGIRFWQSETGAGGTGIAGNLTVANRVVNDLTYMRPVAWLDWQYIEEGNDQWCTVQGSFSDQTYAKVKNYYVRMQMSRFIKAGYTLIGVNADNMLAAISPDEDELVVVCINQNTSSRTFRIDLSAFTGVTCTGRYVTSSALSCQSLSALNTDTTYVQSTLSAQSIATFVFSIEGLAEEADIAYDDTTPYLLMPRCGNSVVQMRNDSLVLADFSRGEAAQQWYVRPLADGSYQLYTLEYADDDAPDTLAIYNSGAYYASVALIDSTAAGQTFNFDMQDFDYFQLSSTRDSKILDQESQSYSAGTYLGFWSAGSEHYNAHREWRLARVPFYVEASEDEEVVAGIEGVTAEPSTDENQTEDNTYYDLTGRPVAHPSKGIYLRGKRKVYIK